MHYLFTDGGSRGNPGKSAIAYFIFEDEKLLDFGGKFVGVGTNNSAEYQALILGLKAASKLGIKKLTCNLDSELAVKQLNGEYKISNEDIKKLASSVQKEREKFESVTFNHVLREKNKFADKMVNVILDSVD